MSVADILITFFLVSNFVTDSTYSLFCMVLRLKEEQRFVTI